MSQDKAPNDALRKSLHNALKAWRSTQPVSPEFFSLRLFQEAVAKGDSPRRALNQLLLSSLERLEVKHLDEAQILRDHFIDGQMVHLLANRRNISESNFYQRQARALVHLTAVVEQMEGERLAAYRATIAQRLPALAGLHLVGIEARLAELSPLLLNGAQPWIVSLEGIGGIGKTSLAAALVQHLMGSDHFRQFGWVSAKRSEFNVGEGLLDLDSPTLTVTALVEQLNAQLLSSSYALGGLSSEQQFALLQTHLKERPSLIVIDNLETIADVQALLPTLRQLINPTKFLLTSRESLYPQSDLVRQLVPELSVQHASDLVRQEAQRVGLHDLATATDAVLLPIYQAVGGNPLALRLVVGQSYFHGLATVLGDLEAARGKRIEALYRYIYRQAWDKLDEATRKVFLIMPLISDQGGDLSLMEEISGIESHHLRLAIERLVMANLVDVGGTVDQRHYTIHNLTRTFLQEEIAKWL